MPMRSPAGFISAFFDPLKNPDAPTIGTATGDDSSAAVTFTAPANVGGSAITAYYAVSNPGQITTSGTSSPITATGLTNGTAYTFNVWALNSYGPGPWSAASNSTTPSLQRGIIAGGYSGSTTNAIQYVSISSAGNSASFGFLTVGRGGLAGCASSTRGVFGGGDGNKSVIDYVTIATTGNATNFGNLFQDCDEVSACSNSTRGIFFDGWNASSRFDYITIATTGNSTFFGNLNTPPGPYGSPFNVYNGVMYRSAAFASSTRGVMGGGYSPYDGLVAYIKYMEIASTGNSSSFGNLLSGVQYAAGFSSSTRGIFSGGGTSPVTNVIQYVTIASTGNSTDFGDLTVARQYTTGTSSSTTGITTGGYGSSGGSNVIDSVTIATTGNAVSFGSLTGNQYFMGACSNCHGGI